MRAEYHYTVIDSQGNVVLEDVKAIDIINHFGLSTKTSMSNYAAKGTLLKGEYRIFAFNAGGKKERVISDRLMQCWKFTAQMLAEWDCMNRRYGRRFRT